MKYYIGNILNNRKNIVGIIQARLGSSRLPNKMLLSLHGRPIIEWVVKRVQKSKLLNNLIVALPDTKENDLLEHYCVQFGVKTFRGSEEDVLLRFYEAAKKVKAEQIVRICADNPLICPGEIDNLIEFFNNCNCDFAYNHRPLNNKYPDGIGAEIVSFDILEKLNFNAKKKDEREHVFNYIYNHSEEFLIKTFDPPNKQLHHPELKFDVDTFEDYLYLHKKKYSIENSSIELVSKFINNE